MEKKSKVKPTDKTMIHLSYETKWKLEKIGTAKDSHEDIILKLINLYHDQFGELHKQLDSKFHKKYTDKPNVDEWTK